MGRHGWGVVRPRRQGQRAPRHGRKTQRNLAYPVSTWELPRGRGGCGGNHHRRDLVESSRVNGGDPPDTAKERGRRGLDTTAENLRWAWGESAWPSYSACGKAAYLGQGHSRPGASTYDPGEGEGGEDRPMSPARQEAKSWQAVAVCGESRRHGGNGGMERRAARYRARSLPTADGGTAGSDAHRSMRKSGVVPPPPLSAGVVRLQWEEDGRHKTDPRRCSCGTAPLGSS